jgi:hypothetical protein
MNSYEGYVERKDAEDSGFEREILKHWRLWLASRRFWSLCLIPRCFSEQFFGMSS